MPRQIADGQSISDAIAAAGGGGGGDSNFGNGALGDAVINTVMEFAGEVNYNTLDVQAAGAVAALLQQKLTVRVVGDCTVDGAIHADGRGATGVAGAAGSTNGGAAGTANSGTGPLGIGGGSFSTAGAGGGGGQNNGTSQTGGTVGASGIADWLSSTATPNGGALDSAGDPGGTLSALLTNRWQNDITTLMTVGQGTGGGGSCGGSGGGGASNNAGNPGAAGTAVADWWLRAERIVLGTRDGRFL